MALKKKTDPKEKLATTFIELAARKGADQITLDAVAKQAKLPFSTAHYHLKSSGMTLVELAIRQVGLHGQEWTRSYLERAGEKAPEIPLLYHYVGATLSWAEKYPAYASLWLFQYHLITISPKSRAAHQPFLDTALARIEDMIYGAFGRGQIPVVKTAPAREVVTQLALAVHLLVMGALTRSMTSSPLDFSTHESAVIKAIDRMLRSP